MLSARIHVVLPKNDLLKQDSTPSSASVFIRYDQAVPVRALLPQIKMLVANSIEGLNYEKVSVVFVPWSGPRSNARRPCGSAPWGGSIRSSSSPSRPGR